MARSESKRNLNSHGSSELRIYMYTNGFFLNTRGLFETKSVSSHGCVFGRVMGLLGIMHLMQFWN